MRLLIALLATSVLAAPLAPSAAAQEVESREGIALQNQIAELRSLVQQMQEQQQGQGSQGAYQGGGNQGGGPAYGQNPPAAGDTAAELVVRVGALEEQVRTLQGRVDDLSNQLQRQSDQLGKQISDLEFRLGQGGAPQGAAPGSGIAPGEPPPPEMSPPPGSLSLSPAPRAAPRPPPALPVPAVPPAAVRRTPELALREGNAALARRDYAAAAAAAREVIAGHGARGGADAQVLLARAEAGQHQYSQAAADYYVAYNHAPHSALAPVALLGVANALIGMGDGRDACQALAKLGTEFPNPGTSVHAGAAAARKRAACH